MHALVPRSGSRDLHPADVMGGATLIVARTDAHSARLLTSDVDERDGPFLTGTRTPEGFFGITGGIEMAIARAIAYAPYADLLWCETSTPDLTEARRFAEAVRERYPRKKLAYNCSPSFNWKKKLDSHTIARFQRELGAMGYKFQFVTLAGVPRAQSHDVPTGSRLQRARHGCVRRTTGSGVCSRGVRLHGYEAPAGTGYFDEVMQVISGGSASTLALGGSTERSQFH